MRPSCRACRMRSAQKGMSRRSLGSDQYAMSLNLDRQRWHGHAIVSKLLVASLPSCRMPWYLHLCAITGIVALDYRDEASGTMQEEDSGGAFVRAALKPRVTIAKGADRAKALALHEKAHHLCFIARSVRFPVDLAPQIPD